MAADHHRHPGPVGCQHNSPSLESVNAAAPRSPPPAPFGLSPDTEASIRARRSRSLTASPSVRTGGCASISRSNDHARAARVDQSSACVASASRSRACSTPVLRKSCTSAKPPAAGRSPKRVVASHSPLGRWGSAAQPMSAPIVIIVLSLNSAVNAAGRLGAPTLPRPRCRRARRSSLSQVACQAVSSRSRFGRDRQGS